MVRVHREAPHDNHERNGTMARVQTRRGVSMSAVVEAAILPHIEKWEREQGKKP